MVGHITDSKTSALALCPLLSTPRHPLCGHRLYKQTFHPWLASPSRSN